ncbi:MAG: hypothetical protein R3234_13325 [Thermoanaerobaculia bacterium]|nr:hypothetical protein [Thermoanaerobaculia bacterium]
MKRPTASIALLSALALISAILPVSAQTPEPPPEVAPNGPSIQEFDWLVGH